MDDNEASSPYGINRLAHDSCLKILAWTQQSKAIRYILIVCVCIFLPPKILSLFPSKLESKISSLPLQEIPTIHLKPGSTLPASESYIPVENNNFYFLTWFRLKELPRDGDSFGIFEKVDMQRRNRNGYALSLKRYGEELRPEVYWRNEDGRGKLFTFAPIEVLPGNWTMLVLSFRKNEALNVYAGISVDGERIEPKNLGGYIFESPTLLAESTSPVRLTNVVGQRLKGEFGPIGIFSGGSSHTLVSTIVNEGLMDPLSPPRTFKKSAIKFWISK